MNMTQKTFLKTLLRSIEQAQVTQTQIANAMAIGVKNREACIDYAQALQQYIHDAKRMAMQCTIAYGDGADLIALKASANDTNNN
jgi:hypothetical protein